MALPHEEHDLVCSAGSQIQDSCECCQQPGAAPPLVLLFLMSGVSLGREERSQRREAPG